MKPQKSTDKVEQGAIISFENEEQADNTPKADLETRVKPAKKINTESVELDVKRIMPVYDAFWTLHNNYLGEKNNAIRAEVDDALAAVTEFLKYKDQFRTINNRLTYCKAHLNDAVVSLIIDEKIDPRLIQEYNKIKIPLSVRKDIARSIDDMTYEINTSVADLVESDKISPAIQKSQAITEMNEDLKKIDGIIEVKILVENLHAKIERLLDHITPTTEYLGKIPAEDYLRAAEQFRADMSRCSANNLKTVHYKYYRNHITDVEVREYKPKPASNVTQTKPKPFLFGIFGS